MNITAYDLASRYLGIEEIHGEKHHPLILWWHSLATMKATTDEIPWCSVFCGGIAWELDLPRSPSAAARSWLVVGKEISLDAAKPGFDIVVLKRGGGDQPGPEVLHAPGHVGWYSSHDNFFVDLLGGNQGDQVSIASFERSRILSVRRLYEETNWGRVCSP